MMGFHEVMMVYNHYKADDGVSWSDDGYRARCRPRPGVWSTSGRSCRRWDCRMTRSSFLRTLPIGWNTSRPWHSQTFVAWESGWGRGFCCSSLLVFVLPPSLLLHLSPCLCLSIFLFILCLIIPPAVWITDFMSDHSPSCMDHRFHVWSFPQLYGSQISCLIIPPAVWITDFMSDHSPSCMDHRFHVWSFPQLYGSQISCLIIPPAVWITDFMSDHSPSCMDHRFHVWSFPQLYGSQISCLIIPPAVWITDFMSDHSPSCMDHRFHVWSFPQLYGSQISCLIIPPAVWITEFMSDHSPSCMDHRPNVWFAGWLEAKLYHNGCQPILRFLRAMAVCSA